jgi:hypothetical protein
MQHPNVGEDDRDNSVLVRCNIGPGSMDDKAIQTMDKGRS